MRPWSRRARQPCLHPVYGRTPGSSSASSGDPAGENGSPTSPHHYHCGRRASGCFVEDAPSHSQSKIAPFILELKSERNTLRGQGWGVTAE